jgi:hypothetical protein
MHFQDIQGLLEFEQSVPGFWILIGEKVVDLHLRREVHPDSAELARHNTAKPF